MSQLGVSYHSLAGRGARWGGAMIDSIISFVAVGPGYLMGGIDQERSLTGLIVLLLGSIVLLAIQAFFLIRDGQTLGKKVVGVRIVRADNGEPASWPRLLLLRGLLSGVISLIPAIGTIYALVDALFIFREDRRCLHDHMAGTVVISA